MDVFESIEEGNTDSLVVSVDGGVVGLMVEDYHQLRRLRRWRVVAEGVVVLGIFNVACEEGG